MLLLAMHSFVNVEIFCKPLAIFAAPNAWRLFVPMSNSCRWILQVIAVAISSAASKPMLLLAMHNFVYVEIFCKPFAIFAAPNSLRLFLPMSNSCRWILQETASAISSAAS